MTTKEQLMNLRDRLRETSSVISLYLLIETRSIENPLIVKRVLYDNNVKSAICDVAYQYFTKLGESDFPADTIIPVHDCDDDQVLFYLNENVILQWASAAEDLNTNNEDYFDMRNRSNLKIKAWVFKADFQNAENMDSFVIFQEFQNAKLLALKLLTMFIEDHVLKLIDENLINFNESMDFLLYHDCFYMQKIKAFERVFSYQNIYKDNAKTLIDSIQSEVYNQGMTKLVITDPDSLKLKIDGSVRFAQKLYSAKEKGYYKTISFKKLTSLNHQHKLNLSLDSSTKTWTIDNALQSSIVERILNDDYEKSLLTNNEYISKKKQQIV